jgi:CubicO group peptidase (beta-lactamase class C family)
MKSVLRSRFTALAAVLALLAVIPAAPAQKSNGGEKKRLAEVLKPYVDSQSLAGAVVLVANKDKVLDAEAVGYADVAAMLKMPIDALFWIASMSKPITATALMILVDEGKVSLNDPVERYLPEFKGKWVVAAKEKGQKPTPAKRSVTVRDVLSHTSGLVFRSPQEQPTIDVLPLKDAVRSYTEVPLLFEPGTAYQYSNAGINTAGRIIEVVSGMPYEVFLEKKLFGPLGMKDTTFFPSEEQLKRLAKSYSPNKEKTGLQEIKIGQLKSPLTDAKRYPVPGGGLFSTAQDVGVFCQMILGGGVYKGKRYLSEEAVKEMARRQTGEKMPGYGLGWSAGGDNFGHGGAYATNMTVDTKRGLVLVWMVQHAGFPGNGGESQGAFRKAALEMYGNPQK